MPEPKAEKQGIKTVPRKPCSSFQADTPADLQTESFKNDFQNGNFTLISASQNVEMDAKDQTYTCVYLGTMLCTLQWPVSPLAAENKGNILHHKKKNTLMLQQGCLCQEEKNQTTDTNTELTDRRLRLSFLFLMKTPLSKCRSVLHPCPVFFISRGCFPHP